MQKINVPMFNVKLRHPEFGWQVVAVAEKEVDAIKSFDGWLAKTNYSCMMYVAKISGDQTWSIIRDFEPRNAIEVLSKQLAEHLRQGTGVAATIRLVTTFNPTATVAQMIKAGEMIEMNAATIRTQFSKARREDAQVDRAQKAAERKIKRS